MHEETYWREIAAIVEGRFFEPDLNGRANGRVPAKPARAGA